MYTGKKRPLNTSYLLRDTSDDDGTFNVVNVNPQPPRFSSSSTIRTSSPLFSTRIATIADPEPPMLEQLEDISSDSLVDISDASFNFEDNDTPAPPPPQQHQPVAQPPPQQVQQQPQNRHQFEETMREIKVQDAKLKVQAKEAYIKAQQQIEEEAKAKKDYYKMKARLLREKF